MGEQKVALVTGGSRGIGAAIVKALAKAGYDIALSYRQRAPEAAAVCDALKSEGRNARAFACDMNDRAACDRLVADTLGTLGRIDVLVNNAGTHVPMVRFADLGDDDWDRVMGANLTAPFRIARAVLPHMRSRRTGHIVNLSSNVALRFPAGYGVYTVSKAGLEAFTRILAKEEGANGIRVNGVGPGPIRTEMLQESFDALGAERAQAFVKSITLGRMGEPKEIAAVVAFLVSDAASYMTGQIVYANGGGVA